MAGVLTNKHSQETEQHQKQFSKSNQPTQMWYRDTIYLEHIHKIQCRKNEWPKQLLESSAKAPP